MVSGGWELLAFSVWERVEGRVWWLVGRGLHGAALGWAWLALALALALVYVYELGTD